jgi:hypothetical protein
MNLLPVLAVLLLGAAAPPGRVHGRPSHAVRLDSDRLAAGVYYLQLRTEASVRTVNVKVSR